MSEDPQAAEHRQHFGVPAGIDPRNYDPRKVLDATAMEHILKAQAAARAQAAASTTVFIGTIVTLIIVGVRTGGGAGLEHRNNSDWVNKLSADRCSFAASQRYCHLGGCPGDHRDRHRSGGSGDTQPHCRTIRQAKCL